MYEAIQLITDSILLKALTCLSLHQQVKNITSLVEVIPHDIRPFSVNKLVIQRNKITLNEQDRLALTTYHNLVELHLDANLVTRLTANYFSVAPHL